MAWIRTRITFANVMSLTALFIALGGTSYAVTQLDKNSVRSKHIRNGQVKRPDLGRNAVDSSKVRDASLLLADFAPGQFSSLQSQLQGPQGPPGERGLQGEQGPAGENGSAHAFARVREDGTLQPDVSGFPSQNKSTIVISKGEGGASTGTYCFDLDQRPASAMVSLDSIDALAADRNLVTSVAIDRGEDLGDCPANRNDARVRIVDGNTAAAQDAKFFIWFEF
jgi:hypothetical protein